MLPTIYFINDLLSSDNILRMLMRLSDRTPKRCLRRWRAKGNRDSINVDNYLEDSATN